MIVVSLQAEEFSPPQPRLLKPVPSIILPALAINSLVEPYLSPTPGPPVMGFQMSTEICQSAVGVHFMPCKNSETKVGPAPNQLLENIDVVVIRAGDRLPAVICRVEIPPRRHMVMVAGIGTIVIREPGIDSQ